MKTLALFDPINSGEGLKYTAKKLGFQVVGIFTRPIELFEKQYHVSKKQLFQNCDQIIVAEDINSILQQIKTLKLSISGAIAGLDSGVELADELAHILKLRGNAITLSSARRDKGKMRQLLKKEGFACPDFTVCSSEDEAVTFAKTHPWPLVVKTPRGAATSQVFVCENLDQVLESFRDIIQGENFFGQKSQSAVIEEYISGNEYIIDTFSDGENVHVTDLWVYEKIQLNNVKNIYYNAISLPISDPSYQSLIEHGLHLVKAFGLIRGPAHLEIKEDPHRGPTLIEINARLAGAKIPEFLGKYSNFDLFKATIDVFTQEKVQVPTPISYQKQFAIACCPLLQSGTIASISGIEEIQQLDSYEMHQLSVKKGETLAQTTSSTTIALFVYLANADRKQLLKDLNQAHALFQVCFQN